MRARLSGFLSGLLAALAGAGAGHLVAALLNPTSSPVLAVSVQVIDLTPTWLKVWAVRELGSADIPVLIGSVIGVTLLLAGLAGVVARRRLGLGVGMLLVLVGLATAAAVLRRSAGPLDVVPGLVTAVVGVGVLLYLTRATGAGSGGEGAPAGNRRAFLIGAGGAALLAAVAGGAGQLIVRARDRVAELVLPTPTDVPPALPAGFDGDLAVAPLQTPTADFYRVDINPVVPVVDVEGWTLTIDGDVDQEVVLTYEDLAQMNVVERDLTMTCVSNEVGGDLIGGARWLGVPLLDVLALAGIDNTSADQLLSTAVDLTISTPLDHVRNTPEAMVVFGMNGEQLPREHGFPVRLVIPGIYGFVGSTKWVERLTLTTYEEEVAYWTERQWATDAPIKLSSRIDTPRPLSTVEAGEVVLGGMAWAQPHGVATVEISIDGGDWEEAELSPDVNANYWRQWRFEWEATSGRHDIAVRSTDTRGEVQTEERMSPFPEGSSGIQSIALIVS